MNSISYFIFCLELGFACVPSTILNWKSSRASECLKFQNIRGSWSLGHDEDKDPGVVLSFQGSRGGSSCHQWL